MRPTNYDCARAGYGATRTEPFVQMRCRPHYDEVGHFFTGRVRAHAIDFVR
jgi:hypothetical protein